ncbi:thymidine phosphorylase [Skermanella aerolata]|uniref:Thymidine phosphorylase n=1 Tax=Skermanella aerolata TaxID=393310 RepID=A0A512DM30_9PROT|nr:thymidine phosphorylase [Skermanella aerolata]KJB92891.1 thymidine phosphorylase [Skermanella aerolata KACC 11604]GEO37220.1 thymidine phosphorylase [Skermanella aerolata]
MLPQEIIRVKRDGGRLNEAQIQRFIQGVTSGAVTEGQIAAFCMAVLFRGMDLDERVALTLAMTRSGTVLDWKPLNLPGPILDKHSTGGVGDKVSLILAPAIAACGGFVPMISGRGLGHTGGTLDKLDSIPGYVSLPDRTTLERVIRDAGCAIIGATDAFAPADKRVYAVRDITATVESLDLITASILSKKLAAGLDALVMDVKFGSGAFMAEFDDAVALAESIVTVATGAGMPTVALLTDMNEVLGRTAGNALEVRESIDLLTGAGHDPRLYEVTAALSAELLVLGGLCPDTAAARTRFDDVISSGAAAERFGRMVSALGGPADLMENPDRYLASAPVVREVHADASGSIAAIDTRALGVAVVALGGGRSRVQDPIDPAVGLSAVAGLGAAAGPQGSPQSGPLAIVHARSEDEAEAAADAVRAAFTIGAPAPVPTSPVARRLAH